MLPASARPPSWFETSYRYQVLTPVKSPEAVKRIFAARGSILSGFLHTIDDQNFYRPLGPFQL
jgi:hypothetical protein